MLVIAGLLVGIGTRLGSGCTSGHGVCGISRFSARSIVATLTFMAAGIATVAAMNALGLEVSAMNRTGFPPSLLSGILFGAGLALGGMTDPARVRGFLDLFGAWDPTLAFVMGGAVVVMASHGGWLPACANHGSPKPSTCRHAPTSPRG